MPLAILLQMRRRRHYADAESYLRRRLRRCRPKPLAAPAHDAGLMMPRGRGHVEHSRWPGAPGQLGCLPISSTPAERRDRIRGQLHQSTPAATSAAFSRVVVVIATDQIAALSIVAPAFAVMAGRKRMAMHSG